MANLNITAELSKTTDIIAEISSKVVDVDIEKTTEYIATVNNEDA